MRIQPSLIEQDEGFITQEEQVITQEQQVITRDEKSIIGRLGIDEGRRR